jgi:hypothetical protein
MLTISFHKSLVCLIRKNSQYSCVAKERIPAEGAKSNVPCCARQVRAAYIYVGFADFCKDLFDREQRKQAIITVLDNYDHFLDYVVFFQIKGAMYGCVMTLKLIT